jgi:hypothetical protein
MRVAKGERHGVDGIRVDQDSKAVPFGGRRPEEMILFSFPHFAPLKILFRQPNRETDDAHQTDVCLYLLA